MSSSLRPCLAAIAVSNAAFLTASSLFSQIAPGPATTPAAAGAAAVVLDTYNAERLESLSC